MSNDIKVHKRGPITEDGVNTNQLAAFHSAIEESEGGLLPVSMQDVKNNSCFDPRANKNVQPKSLPKRDRPAFAVLVILYLLQGVPVGLAFGSVPFILKSKLSYSLVGVFSLAAYPYSLKLLWSPVVDAFYSPRMGRRRSWIIPIQVICGVSMIILGLNIDTLLLEPEAHLSKITMGFFFLIFFCATQDIAVDGWALTCLSPECLSFASTAQTIGINCGYFLSFTIFLALSSPDFANKYLRNTPLETGLFTLGEYLLFWGWAYLVVSGLLLFVPEDPPHLVTYNQAKLADEKAKTLLAYSNLSNVRRGWLSLKNVYHSMYQVLKLPNVQQFVVILLLAKLGFQVNEGATNLKLLEKGLSKEDLSITVLIDFPFELIFGYYAARWSSGTSPLRPWLIGFVGRLVAALMAQLIVLYFPSDGYVSLRYFLLIILQHLLTSFMSTVQFVSLCAFHTKIADPAIGGTYMTTLNTLSNYGGTWPKLIVYYLIDKFTLSVCELRSGSTDSSGQDRNFSIISESTKEQCLNNGGKIITLRDGYFYVNILCIVCGTLIFLWVKKRVAHLQKLPNSAWRVSSPS